MKKLFVGIVALGLVSSVPLLAHDEKAKKPKPDKVQKVAAEMCFAAMANGAYATLQADALVQYCVDVAVGLAAADYTVP